jgi:hypothetical protein
MATIRSVSFTRQLYTLRMAVGPWGVGVKRRLGAGSDWPWEGRRGALRPAAGAAHGGGRSTGTPQKRGALGARTQSCRAWAAGRWRTSAYSAATAAVMAASGMSLQSWSMPTSGLPNAEGPVTVIE